MNGKWGAFVENSPETLEGMAAVPWATRLWHTFVLCTVGHSTKAKGKLGARCVGINTPLGTTPPGYEPPLGTKLPRYPTPWVPTPTVSRLGA